MQPSGYLIVWILLLASLGGDVLGMQHYGIAFSMGKAWVAALALCLLATGLCVYRYLRPDWRIFMLLQAAVVFLLSIPITAFLSYLAAAAHYPLVDAQLVALDHLLGFDWREHIAWLQVHQTLWLALKWIYLSMLPQIVLVILLTWLFHAYTECRQFILAMVLGALLTIALFMVFPAVGGYVYYNITPQDLPLIPAAARVHEAHLLALRAHALPVFVVSETQGIVSFPSFHATMAVLLMWVARPWRWIFFFSTLLNTMMIFSVLSQGGHYLADAVGGVVVAFMAIALTLMIDPKAARAI